MSNWDKLHMERADNAETGVIVIRLSGVLDSAPECYAFLSEVQELAHTGPVRVVIDLAHLTRLASAGVGILAACFTSITNAGGMMSLCAIPPRAGMVLKVVRLLDVVPNAADEAEAIRLVG